MQKKIPLIEEDCFKFFQKKNFKNKFDNIFRPTL